MILNFGSINIDHFYYTPDLPKPGETLSASDYEKFLGGKGINQSIAIAQAGGSVRHIGAVGDDGDWVLSQISTYGVSLDGIAKLDGPTGHACVMVDAQSENQIIIVGGSNQRLTKTQIDAALSAADPAVDWVLLQNETNLASYIVTQAKAAGFKICYAAAPFIADVTIALLPQIDLLVLNEGEAADLRAALGHDIDGPELLITKGSKGAQLRQNGTTFEQTAFKVEAVDTVGAGDTFTGSYLSQIAEGQTPQTALAFASAASAIQVTRKGAATAIPTRDEVLDFLKHQTKDSA